jgi:pSer/pThr/pTyr-binding forkhead associated (FHA) protein
MTEQQFVISPYLLSGLSGLIPGEKSPLSPLNVPNPPELTSDQRAELIKAGLFDENGLVEPARLLLAALSEVPSFARLRMNAPNGYVDEAVHFTGEGAQSIGISNTPDGLVLTTPGNVDAILNKLKEYVGDSIHDAGSWSVELQPTEMLVLAALLDMRRKAVLHAILDQQPVVPPPGDPQSVVTAIQAMWSDPQWLTTAIQNTANIQAAPDAQQAHVALMALADKELVWLQDSSFLPVPEVIAIIDRFLLIGNILTLDAGNSNLQGRYVMTRQCWLQTGVSEMLHLSSNASLFRLEVVSPAAVIEKLRFYLTTFDAIPAPAIEVLNLAVTIEMGTGSGQSFPLVDETVIGRSEQAHVRIFDVRASRRHAVIRKISQGYQLSDAGSTNGTYLNGQFLTSPSWLHPGDIIRIGETQIKVISAGDASPAVTDDRTVFVSGAGRSEEPRISRPASAQAPAIINLPPAAPVEPPVEPPAEPPAIESPVAVPPFMEMPPVESPAAPEQPPAEPDPAESQPAVPPETLILPEEPQPEASLCARCHEPLGPGDLVCRNCGWPVNLPPAETFAPPPPPPAALCPNCGSPTNPGARFCGTCGYRLAQ